MADAKDLYNRALYDVSLQQEFKRTFQPIKLSLYKKSGDTFVREIGVKPTFKENPVTGNFIAVQEGGHYLIFPMFGADMYQTVDIEQAFEVKQVAKRMETDPFVVKVEKPAITIKLESGEYEVAQEGLLYIGVRGYTGKDEPRPEPKPAVEKPKPLETSGAQDGIRVDVPASAGEDYINTMFPSTKTPTLVREEFGRFRLFEQPDRLAHVIVPVGSIPPEYLTLIDLFFYLNATLSSVARITRLVRPAIVRKIDPNTWELVERGELDVLAVSEQQIASFKTKKEKPKEQPDTAKTMKEVESLREKTKLDMEEVLSEMKGQKKKSPKMDMDKVIAHIKKMRKNE